MAGFSPEADFKRCVRLEGAHKQGGAETINISRRRQSVVVNAELKPLQPSATMPTLRLIPTELAGPTGRGNR